ncbi:hypothetical protein [Microvirga zambiensis]|uniref:hypothetical protein n=1 Tax=Microvirga zambiensis TaxID=1402137 RepID=UPI00191DB655|nr:hypothetical protein [Microvirga zambiensis]
MKHRNSHKWSLSSCALNGGLIGIAVGAIHQVYRAFTNDIPEEIYMQVVGEVIVAAICGAILFIVIAAIRNRLRRENSA